jgi:hypothetical protein
MGARPRANSAATVAAGAILRSMQHLTHRDVRAELQCEWSDDDHASFSARVGTFIVARATLTRGCERWLFLALSELVARGLLNLDALKHWIALHEAGDLPR